jgi:hypothetical protein
MRKKKGTLTVSHTCTWGKEEGGYQEIVSATRKPKETPHVLAFGAREGLAISKPSVSHLERARAPTFMARVRLRERLWRG